MARVDWEPRPSDIGAILRARTKATSGREVGTFNEDTRPTGSQVQELIESAVAKVDARVGTVPETLWVHARRVAALRAAMFVELSYFPEQVNAGRSVYTHLKAEFDEELAELIVEVTSSNDTDGVLGQPALSPAYSFPVAEYPTPMMTPW
jgi:hypothetical protein